jgi:hypothetical protein
MSATAVNGRTRRRARGPAAIEEALPVEGEVIEGTAVDLMPVLAAPAQLLAVTPQVKASELVARLSVIREAMQTAMVNGIDYGRVPGTEKPTLFKPGAEKLGVLFQLDLQYVNEKIWGPEEHLTVISHGTVFHAPSGTRQGYGEGVCTTRERKYAYRKQERLCPACSMPAVIAGKPEYGGGWVCWGKRGGCGSKFAEADAQITGQEVGEVENPDLPDLWNTVVKMAKKRAQVDAILSVTGASALFTQDAAEDQREPPPVVPPIDSPEHDPVRPTARAPRPSDRPATVEQRNQLRDRAGKAGLTPTDFANLVLVAKDKPVRVWADEIEASRWLKVELERLAAKHVDAVLVGIVKS